MLWEKTGQQIAGTTQGSSGPPGWAECSTISSTISNKQRELAGMTQYFGSQRPPPMMYFQQQRHTPKLPKECHQLRITCSHTWACRKCSHSNLLTRESRNFLRFRAFIRWEWKQKSNCGKHLVKAQRVWKIRGAQHIFNHTVIMGKTFSKVRKRLQRAGKCQPEFSAQSRIIEEETVWPMGVLINISLAY